MYLSSTINAGRWTRTLIAVQCFWRELRTNLNIPNIFTIVRGLAVPITIITILIWSSLVSPTSFWIIVAACAADGVDGFIARLLNMVTRIGAALDRSMDKAAFFSILLLIRPVFRVLLEDETLAMVMGTYFLIFFLAIQETFLCSMGFWGCKRGLPIESTVWGKIKMFFEYSLIIWLLMLFHNLHLAYLQPWVNFPLSKTNCLRITLGLLALSNFFAILSIRGYYKIYAPALQPHLDAFKARLRIFTS